MLQIFCTKALLELQRRKIGAHLLQEIKTMRVRVFEQKNDRTARCADFYREGEQKDNGHILWLSYLSSPLLFKGSRDFQMPAQVFSVQIFNNFKPKVWKSPTLIVVPKTVGKWNITIVKWWIKQLTIFKPHVRSFVSSHCIPHPSLSASEICYCSKVNVELTSNCQIALHIPPTTECKIGPRT